MLRAGRYSGFREASPEGLTNRKPIQAPRFCFSAAAAIGEYHEH